MFRLHYRLALFACVLCVACSRPLHATRPDIVWMAGGHAAVSSVAFSPDGQTLASGGGEYTDLAIRLCRVSDGALLRTLTARVVSVAFSPDGQMLASGDHDGAIKLWRVADVKLWIELGCPDRAGYEAMAAEVSQP